MENKEKEAEWNGSLGPFHIVMPVGTELAYVVENMFDFVLDIDICLQMGTDRYLISTVPSQLIFILCLK